MRWPVVAGLTVVWLLLWGAVTPWLVIGGVLASLLALAVFPFPRTGWRWTVRPWPFVVLVAVFAFDLVRASVQVAWLAVRPASPPPSAVVRVHLSCSSSELLMTLTGELVSLVPGSLLIELDDAAGDLVLHVLDARSPERVERARSAVLAQERRLVRAIARRDDLERYESACQEVDA
ncbi:MAG: Na+/H+ antiporter subunit E [Aeromicrobium erythreum]